MTRFIEEVTLDKELFGPLEEKFVERGTLMKDMWELVMPKTSDKLHSFGGKSETMMQLKKILQSQTTRTLGNDCSWAREALDKALNPRQKRVRIPDQHTGGFYGMPLVKGDMFGGKMSPQSLQELGAPPPSLPSVGVDQLRLPTLPLETSELANNSQARAKI